MRVGFAKNDISVFVPGMPLNGWAQIYNRGEGVAEPLHVRAMVLESAEEEAAAGMPKVSVRTVRRFAYACLDLCFVSEALRQGVLARLRERHAALGFDEHRVMLTATHTHSGPSGYSKYYYYNIPNQGFAPEVLEALIAETTACIATAAAQAEPATLRLTRGAVPLSSPVAFNRSPEAYSLNHDVEPVARARRDEATDRTMTVLRAENAHGALLGFVCWFATHGTSVHAENTLLHPDNKGMAALGFERTRGGVAIFAQEAAGDVSPNFRFDRARGKMIGAYDDDHASAELCGTLQRRTAEQLLDAPGEVVDGSFVAALRYVDFARADVDPRFAHGRQDVRTGPAVVGVAMARGTDEGPGPMHKLTALHRALLAAVRAHGGLAGPRRSGAEWLARQGPKWPLIDVWRGERARLCGIFPLRHPLTPGFVDPTTRYLKQSAVEGFTGERSLVPQNLPVQIFALGPLCIAALPCEPTTVAGRRLRATLGGVLAASGVRQVIVNGFANAYCGYLTTFEEYQLQTYEGGCTLFGPWSLGAYQTAFVCLAEALVGGAWDADDLGASPAPFHDAELQARVYRAEGGRWLPRFGSDRTGLGGAPRWTSTSFAPGAPS